MFFTRSSLVFFNIPFISLQKKTSQITIYIAFVIMLNLEKNKTKIKEGTIKSTKLIVNFHNNNNKNIFCFNI